MGSELPCTRHQAGKTSSGKALLESSELLFRGDTRLKIPFAAIISVDATDGHLHVRTKDGLAIFGLGPPAAKWREKIANPKSVLDKLGVKPGHTVSLVGDFPADFLAALKKQGTEVSNKLTARAGTIFFLANEKDDPGSLPPVSKSMRGATALWLVHPQGQKSITESDVRSSGLRSGLVDGKVVSFSVTHTALKFVLAKSKRKPEEAGRRFCFCVPAGFPTGPSSCSVPNQSVVILSAAKDPSSIPASRPQHPCHQPSAVGAAKVSPARKRSVPIHAHPEHRRCDTASRFRVLRVSVTSSLSLPTVYFLPGCTSGTPFPAKLYATLSPLHNPLEASPESGSTWILMSSWRASTSPLATGPTGIGSTEPCDVPI